MKSRHLTGALLVTPLALPSAAQAHVTLQPNQATAKAFTVEDVRVPNERDTAATTKVDVQFPHGFVFASYQATPGWTVKVTKAKLATPIKTDDGVLTEEVRRIVWTARSKAAAIQPGEFRDFPLSVQVPDVAGQKLTFKALQTYSNGEIVRWIGPPSAAEPAPQVTVSAASEGSKTSTPDPGKKASKGLGIAALIVGIAGLLLGGAALTRRKA